MPSAILLQILAICPAPTFSQLKTLLPIPSTMGLTWSNI